MLPHCKSVHSLLLLLLLAYADASPRRNSVAASGITTNSMLPVRLAETPETVSIVETTTPTNSQFSRSRVDAMKIIPTNMYLRRNPTSVANNDARVQHLDYDKNDVVAHHYCHRMIQANRDDPPFPPVIGILIPIVIILTIILTSCACCKCCYFYPYLCCVFPEDKEEILQGRKKKKATMPPSELPNDTN
jgi:hypothetical protein